MDNLASTYLGLPLTIKKVSNQFWNTILERMQYKLIGWKGKVLRSASKLKLLTSSLKGVPVYLISLFKIIGKSRSTIEKIQFNFMLSRTEEKSRMSLVAWEKVFKPKS